MGYHARARGCFGTAHRGQFFQHALLFLWEDLSLRVGPVALMFLGV